MKYIFFFFLLISNLAYAQFATEQCITLEPNQKHLCLQISSKEDLSTAKSYSFQINANDNILINKAEAIWFDDNFYITSVPKKIIQNTESEFELDTVILALTGKWSLNIDIIYKNQSYTFEIPLLVGTENNSK